MMRLIDDTQKHVYTTTTGKINQQEKNDISMSSFPNPPQYASFQIPANDVRQRYMPNPNVPNEDQEYPQLPGVYGASVASLPQWQQPGETNPQMFATASASPRSQSFALASSAPTDNFETWLSSSRYEAVKNQQVPFGVRDLEPVNAIVQSTLSSEQQRPDQLAYAFASPQNAYQIHRLLSLFILDRLQTPLYLQPLQELADLMTGAYLAYRRQRTGDLSFDLKRMNLNVLNAAAPQVLSSMRQHAQWVRNLDQVPTPMPRPTQDPFRQQRDDSMSMRDLSHRNEEISQVYNQRNSASYGKWKSRQQ